MTDVETYRGRSTPKLAYSPPLTKSTPTRRFLCMTNTASNTASNASDPMSREDLTAWLTLRVDTADVAAMVDEFLGKTEDEMEELYGTVHGLIA